MTDLLTRPSVPPATDEASPEDEDRPGRVGWGPWAQLAVTAVAGALYLSNLSVNGLGNPYYAAAVKSGSVSWKAFFFGSLDPGSFITVDKPPAAFWVQAISVRLFGYSSWSLLIPEALAGALAVAVTYHLARRFAGEVAGVLAGLALAVTPMATVMFRFNDPDALMTLLLVLAAWAVWVAVERGSIAHLVLGAALVGLAFDAKMLEAFVVLPGLALAWVVAAPTSWRRRLWGGAWSALALVLSAGWWVAIVQLWPADARPYIGSTSDNNLLSLIFGYNGLSRLFGGSRGGLASLGATGFGGGAGWTRIFGDTLGTQVSWLVPLAALGLVGGLVLAGRARRTDRGRAGFLLWGGWGVVAFAVFSKASGTFHPYYTVALAPAAAVLAGAGAVALWELGQARRWAAWMLPLGIAGSTVWSFVLLDRDPAYHPWLRVAVAVAGALGALGVLVALLMGAGRSAHESGAADDAVEPPAPPPAPGSRIPRVLARSAVVVSALSLLAGPLAWSLSSLTHASNGTNPTAGPASAGTAGFGGGAGRSGRGGPGGSFSRGRTGTAPGGAPGTGTSEPTAGDLALAGYLESHRSGAKFIVATDGSMPADGLIIASGQPVMAMGGFSGGDPVPTLARFEKLVAEGQVRYVLVGGGGFGGGFGGGIAFHLNASQIRSIVQEIRAGAFSHRSPGTVQQVLSWVEAHGKAVPASDYGSGVPGTLYEVTPADVATQ